MPTREELTYKLVVIGEPAVGKSNLMFRFTEGTFVETHRETRGIDFVSKEIVVDDRDVTLEIFDTAGQEEQGPVVKLSFNGSHGALVVFDLTRRSTFDCIPRWIEDFRSRAGQSPIVMLVGNKSDLRDAREVQDYEAQRLAMENGMCYFETSAKDGDNVDKVFHFIGQEIYRSVSDGTVIRERHGRLGPTVPIKLAPANAPATKPKKRCNC